MSAFLTKSEIAAKMEIDVKTLAHYTNNRYFDDLEKLGYTKNQKKLTVVQVNYLKERLGF